MANIYEQAIEKWGKDRQKNKAIEELSELIRAISKNDRENVIEECVDVGIVLHQVYEIYKVSLNEWEEMKEKKEAKFKKALDE